ncbi:MAG: four helix bundle protein [Candidatus Omnitrophota bacterium]|jgi:four helix bundle protein
MCNGTEKYIFDFEKLRVYEIALEFVYKIFRITKELPRDYQYSLGDQIRRAALSVVNNIAEGSGKLSKKEKSQFYRVALNSARECIPMLTILGKENLLSESDGHNLRESCIYICNMLGKLIAAI